jgi:hypothetical protein
MTWSRALHQTAGGYSARRDAIQLTARMPPDNARYRDSALGWNQA